MAKSIRTNQEHYVDNVRFYQAMVERSEAVNKLLLENGLPVDKDHRTESLRIFRERNGTFPPISEYIGECILKIAQRLLFHSWFSGYTESWKEDMLGDGLENVINYLDNFNTEVTKNPFAYYTQITWYAFRRRIAKEKKQQYVKFKAIQMSKLYDDNVTQEGDKTYKNEYIKFVQQNMGDTIKQFEDKQAAAKSKIIKAAKKKTGLGKLLEIPNEI
jgi:hypothetical protein